MMIRHALYPLLLFLLPMITKASHVYGSLGNLVIPIDLEFGPDSMVVRSHVPPSAPAMLESSVNLHIFSKQLVAYRDEKYGACFVSSFNATMDGMKQRVRDAVSHQGDLGGVKEEVIFTSLLTSLPEKVAARFGIRIKQFCYPFPIYFVNDRNSIVLKSSDVLSNPRIKRDVVPNSFWDDGTGGDGDILGTIKVC